MSFSGTAIPHHLFFTALMFIACAGAAGPMDGMQLAHGLYQDRMWTACRTETRRMLLAEPKNHEARLLLARAEDKLDMNALPAFVALADAADTPDSVRWPARYEQAVLLWRQGAQTASMEALRAVFLNTRDGDLFLKSGCALTQTLRTQPMPWDGAAGIGPQLRSSAPRWTPALIKTVRQDFAAPAGAGFQPGQYFISFYRTQIRPAIGDRCVLAPSCSEYSRQAFKKHGVITGIAMTTDRFIREPGVVAAAARPVTTPGGGIAYADPLRDHDWWFNFP